MTVREYVIELQNDLKTKWVAVSAIWNDPAHPEYDTARFEWQLATNKYCEFTTKLLNNPGVDINGPMNETNWN